MHLDWLQIRRSHGKIQNLTPSTSHTVQRILFIILLADTACDRKVPGLSRGLLTLHRRG
jgi:hypothetical protein